MIDFKSIVDDVRSNMYDKEKLSGMIQRAEEDIVESIKKHPSNKSWEYNIVFSNDVLLESAYNNIFKLGLDKTTNLSISSSKSHEIGYHYNKPTLKFSYTYKEEV